MIRAATIALLTLAVATMIASRLSRHPFDPAVPTERGSTHQGATVPADRVASVA
jgi:hypothetical protein